MLTVTVVVPTRNRRGELTRLLLRLGDAARPAQPAEVIVVDDGSTDDTADVLGRSTWPFPLRVVRQEGLGAAIARNAGARLATGDVLLFLDDDLEPEGGLVAAHTAAHERTLDLVAVGDLPPKVADATFLARMLRYWWDGMQSPVREPGHRYSYTDLLSGHFSIRRSDFTRLGGFDERLRCREDYELGYRAIAAGLQLRFLPEAVAAHHDSSDLGKVFKRKTGEGVADVHLLRWHPDLAVTLSLGRRAAHSRLQRAMIWLVWTAPALGAATARALTALLPLLERARRRRRWRGVLSALLSYWYWRGVASIVRTYPELEAQLAAVPARVVQPLVVNLAHGLEAAEARLDAARPRAARLVLDDAVVGDIPDRPGAEPLRGAHLRPYLATVLRTPYLHALAATGRVPPPLVAAAAALLSRTPAGTGRRAAAA